MHTETFAEAQVEGGRSFHPPAFKIKLGEAVPDEEVATNQLEELLCGKVVAHIGIADPRGDVHGPGSRGKQGSLRNAESSFGTQAIAGSKVRPILARPVGIVMNLVADRVVQLYRARNVIGGASRRLLRESPHVRITAVDKFTWCQIQFEIHDSFIIPQIMAFVLPMRAM